MRDKSLWAVLVLGLAARVALASYFYGSGDAHIWESFASFWPEGRSPYESFFYNYAPPWYWVISLVGALSRATGWPFYFLIKCPLILGDVAIFAVLYTAVLKLSRSRRAAGLSATLFFLNPVSILLTGYHGAFDNLSILFVLLGWYAFTFFPEKRAGLFGTLFFAFGVCVKHFNVLLAPAFALRQKGIAQKLLVLAAAPTLLILLILPYSASVGFPTIIHNMFGWSLHGGYWGWSGVICRSVLFFTGVDLIAQPWFVIIDKFNFFLYLAIFLASAYWARRRDLLDSLLLVFLLFYTFTTQIAPQYTLWIIPLAALRPNRYFYAYSIAGGAQVGLFLYCHTHWYSHIPFAAGLPEFASEGFVIARYLTWAVCVLWFFSLARSGGRSPATL